MSTPVPTSQHPNTVATPARVSQATAVEQSRAVAEVAAAVQVAQQCRRSLGTARAEMIESCAQLGLADKAFYKFPRGSEIVQGASIYLARELARCWGNVDYGIKELRRDDEAGESEMLAFAWDLQTNTRSSNVFIVPHKRDKKGGAVPLVELRDVYENNANQGARRVREAIFAVLPPWFTEEAEDECRKTLERGNGKPLAERIDSAVSIFGGLGVDLARLEQKLGRRRDKWTGGDVAQLRITLKSINRGEITIEDEFPQPRATIGELTAPAAPAGNGAAPAAPEQAATAGNGTAKKAAAKKDTAKRAGQTEADESQYSPDDDGRPYE